MTLGVLQTVLAAVLCLLLKNPDHFKVVKKGDQVEVAYVEAFALAVRPAEKSATKK